MAAVEQAPQTFEHVDPATVGGEQRILVSERSGKGAVLRRARDIGLQLEGDDQRSRKMSAAAVIDEWEDANVDQLRRKLEDDTKKPTHILTVYGYGYKLVP